MRDFMDYVMDSDLRVIVAVLLIIAAVVGGIVYVAYVHDKAHPCVAYSDHPVPVTTYVMVGNVMVPITNMERVCLETK